MTNTTTSPEALVGAWQLRSQSVKTVSGQDVDIWGRDTAGLLVYLRNGYMSVHVSDRNRAAFETNDFLSGTAEEIRNAFERYTTYFGTYEYNQGEELVSHHVHESLFPNWSGVTQKRFAFLQGDTLLIKTPPIAINGEQCVMELYWDRLKEETP